MANQYTPFIPNEYVIKGDYTEMILYDKYLCEKARTLISTECLNLVKPYKWSLNVHGYVENKKVGRLSRFLLNVTDTTVHVDHINGNTLDNTLSNLRLCSHQQNMYNRKMPSTNTSGYKGINKTKSNTYRARIKVNKREISKTFPTLEQAIQWRKDKELEYHKDFRRNQED